MQAGALDAPPLWDIMKSLKWSHWRWERQRKTTFQKSEKSHLPEVNTTKERQIRKPADFVPQNSAEQKGKETREIIAEKAKKNLVTHTENGYQGCQKSDKAVIDTKKELAKIAGVSHDTIAKVEKIEKKAAPEVRKQLDKC